MLLCFQKSAGAREQDMRERATVLQTEFENYVHGSAESVQAAKKGASRSISRAFPTLVGLHVSGRGDILITQISVLGQHELLLLCLLGNM